jgi:hypothetical protein
MPCASSLTFERFEPDSELVGGFCLDYPKQMSATDLQAIEVEGWVVGKKSAAVAVELVHEDVLMRKTPVKASRPDVVASFPGLSVPVQCGFWTAVGTLGLAPRFELRLDVEFEDGNRETLGMLRGNHQPAASGYEPQLRPLMVTSLGRTGTTWLIRLLSEHPKISTHRLYPHETRISAYWMQALKVLSEPCDHWSSAHPETFHENMSWVGHNPFYYSLPARSAETEADKRITEWMSTVQTARLTAFCQQRIDELYLQIANSQGETRPTYFVEKYPQAGHLAWMVWSLYANARELFLFRDFRDMLCSMLAFNAKRGFVAFGRRKDDSDLDFVLTLRNNISRIIQDWQMRSDRALLVRYEDLIREPGKVLDKILRYLDLDHEQAVVERMIEAASKGSSNLDGHRTVAEAGDSIGRWKRDLPPHLQAACQEVFGDLLGKLGYA